MSLCWAERDVCVHIIENQQHRINMSFQVQLTDPFQELYRDAMLSDKKARGTDKEPGSAMVLPCVLCSFKCSPQYYLQTANHVKFHDKSSLAIFFKSTSPSIYQHCISTCSCKAMSWCLYSWVEISVWCLPEQNSMILHVNEREKREDGIWDSQNDLRDHVSHFFL